MPGDKQVRVGFGKRLSLVGKQVERLPRIEFRIVALPSHQATILIVLDELVVGIGGKRQGAQAQGVQRRHPQQAQLRCGSFEAPQVEIDQVVADEAIAGFGEIIELGQCGIQGDGPELLFGECQRRPGSVIDRSEGKDAFVASPNFQVD